MKANLLSCQNLAIGFHGRKKRKTLAENINLCLKEGLLTCLIGSNGIGKTTLMRCLAGLTRPLAGNVFVKGRILSSLGPQERANQISIAFTGVAQSGDLKVAQLVQLGRLPHTNWLGQLSQRDHEIVYSCLKKMDLLTLANRIFATLSDGERQKVLVARSLAQQTGIIMLDEPTAFLDWPNRLDLLCKLKTVAQEENKAILVSSHDLDLVFRLADQIWLMDDRRELICGTPQELIDSESLQNAFSGKYYEFLAGQKGL